MPPFASDKTFLSFLSSPQRKKSPMDAVRPEAGSPSTSAAQFDNRVGLSSPQGPSAEERRKQRKNQGENEQKCALSAKHRSDRTF